MLTLVLASASPARLATLRAAGVAPAVLVSNVDEDAVVAASGLTGAADIALLLAREKADAVAARDDLPAQPVVLGCDSVLELDGQVLGKPRDAAEATRRWYAMRGCSAVLHTGHWLVDKRDDATAVGLDTPWEGGAVESAVVHFAEVTDAEVAAYVATGEPLQVAGAFTIDGLGGAFVRSVDGDPHTVVGISLPLLRLLLAARGVSWHALWRHRHPPADQGTPGRSRNS